MNNNLKFILLLLTLGLFMTSCDKEETTFGDLTGEANRGAIMSVSGSTPGFYNLADADNATNSFDIGSAGEDVSSATLTLSFNGGTAVDVQSLSSVPGSSTLSLIEAAAATGVAIEDLSPGDVFTFGFRDVVTGSGTYRSGKTLDVAVSCTSAIGGTYDAVSVGTSTDGCCPGEVTASAVVTLADVGGGIYDISDWSGGIYFVWYGPDGGDYGILPTSNTGQIQDICNSISFVTDTEPFGETLEGSGSIDPSTGVITYTWLNGYGDQSTVTLTPQ